MQCKSKSFSHYEKKERIKLNPKFKTLLTKIKHFEKFVPSMFDWAEQKLNCKLVRPFLKLVTVYYLNSLLKIGFFLVFSSGIAL